MNKTASTLLWSLLGGSFFLTLLLFSGVIPKKSTAPVSYTDSSTEIPSSADQEMTPAQIYHDKLVVATAPEARLSMIITDAEDAYTEVRPQLCEALLSGKFSKEDLTRLMANAFEVNGVKVEHASDMAEAMYTVTSAPGECD